LAVSDNPVSNNAVSPSNLLSNRSDYQTETPVEVSNTEVKSDLPATVPEKEKMVPKSVQPDAPAIPNDLPVVLNGKFHVVGGCFKIRENADKLAQKLVKQGYPAQVSRHGKDFFKVTVESYETRKEAEKGLGEILEVDPDTDYWLMADKR
jgi:cell division septation protein DedD